MLLYPGLFTTWVSLLFSRDQTYIQYPVQESNPRLQLKRKELNHSANEASYRSKLCFITVPFL